MKAELNDVHLGAWRAFITAHTRLVDQINRDLLAAEQIPLNWYDVLIELGEAPGRRLRMSELADRVVLSRSGLTRLVDRLEKAAYLRRERTSDDGRGAYAVLTDAGWDALRRSWPVYAAGIVNYFARYLDPAEAQLLADAFSAMLAGIAEAE